MILPCLVPLKDGHLMQPEFISALSVQSQKVAVMAVSRAAVPAGKYASQAITRNRLFSLLENVDCRFAAMLDCDNILTDPDALNDACIMLLTSASDLKVVHLRMKPRYTPGHFDIGAMVFVKEIIHHIKFTCDNPQACNCTAFGKQVQRCGWRQTWLNDSQQGRHLAYLKE